MCFTLRNIKKIITNSSGRKLSDKKDLREDDYHPMYHIVVTNNIDASIDGHEEFTKLMIDVLRRLENIFDNLIWSVSSTGYSNRNSKATSYHIKIVDMMQKFDVKKIDFSTKKSRAALKTYRVQDLYTSLKENNIEKICYIILDGETMTLVPKGGEARLWTIAQRINSKNLFNIHQTEDGSVIFTNKRNYLTQ